MLQDEQIASGERQLKDFSKFLQHHEDILAEILTKSASIHDVNDSADCRRNSSRLDGYEGMLIKSAKAKSILRLKSSSAIGIDYSNAEEDMPTMDLVRSPNMCLNKTIAVFVQLCMEVRQLSKEGHQFLVKCLFADEDLCEILNQEDEANDMDGPTAQVHDNDIGGITLSPRIINKISDLMELLFQTQQFTERCFVLVSAIIKQFIALFATENSNYINVNHSSLHFQTVFNHLAEVTCLAIKFDGIFENSQLKNLWPQYVAAVKVAEQNLSRLNESGEITGDGINHLKSVYRRVENLLSGNVFQNHIESLFQVKGQAPGQALAQFSVQFLSYLRNTLTLVQKYVANQTAANSNGQGLATMAQSLPATTSTANVDATNDAVLNIIDEMVCDPSKLVLKMNVMCILYHHLFGNLEQKLFSAVIENNAKFPCIILVENKIWSPEQFLQRFGATLVMKIRGASDKMSTTNIKKFQQQWLQTKCQRLQKDLQLYTIQVVTWIMKVRNDFECRNGSVDQHNLKIDELNQKILLILQGIDYMEKLNSAVTMITNLHASMNCPMTKQNILTVCKLIELLKMIRLTMENVAHEIFNATLCLSQYQLYQALTIIASVKKKFQADSSSANVYDERTVDILSALDLSQMALNGSPNIKRILIARLALSLADPKQLFQSDQLNKICRLFVAIEHLIQFNDVVRSLSSMSFMYWHHEALLSIYLRHIIDGCEAADIEKIHYLLESVTDCHSELSGDSTPSESSTKFAKKVSSLMNELIVAKLCGYVETKLRLDVHMNLQILPVANSDPFEPSAAGQSRNLSVSDMRRMLALKPFAVLDARAGDGTVERYLSIQEHVSAYLSEMFYNLTTISMHDWRTYGQMRYLARQKFQLDTVEDHLPTQTLEQGLDVLEIMRNIHLFVSNYLYNLNNQIFIEKNSNNKHLNTINIRHIANSLRTHGIGIINTTANFTYQFLHKKLYIFSQYLHNENIQSRLMKELKSFREMNMEKPEEEQMYSFERASNFIKSIRHLGVSQSGQSSLDLFQELITHIGNAMGYVRMMRSGGIHCCANASIFLPIVDEELRFEKLCEKNGLSSETVKAAKNLESDIKYLSHNDAKGTDYFRLLVDAFSPFFRSDKNPHLKLFYLIVPPLTLNYIEYIVMAKEKMNKKTKQQGTWFTDDGFAMGLAYVLRLLNEKTEFGALHWFKAVRQKYTGELEQLGRAREESNDNTEPANKTYDDKLQQTIALSERRINIILQEFDLLFCSLNSANIFYQ